MEDSMLVEFESKFSKKKENVICEAIAYGVSKLFPHEDDVVINIHRYIKAALIAKLTAGTAKNKFAKAATITTTIPTVKKPAM